MKNRNIKGELYHSTNDNKFFILEGFFDKFVIENNLIFISRIELKIKDSQYFLTYLVSLENIYEKYKHITNNIIFNLLYLENNKLLLQDNVIEFKNIYNAFQENGKGIADIDGSLFNLYIKQN